MISKKSMNELHRAIKKYDKLVNGHKDFWKGLNRNTLSEFLDWLYK